MKTLIHYLKLNLPLHKAVSLLWFLFTITFTLNAQSLYFVKGTPITIDETTTLFITDSGKVSQTKLRDFEGQILVRREPSNEKQIVFNNKKPGSKKNRKKSVSKFYKLETKTAKKTKPVELIKRCPDNLFLSYHKGIVISISVPDIKYTPKFLIENIRLRPLRRYPIDNNYKIINNSFLLNDHLSQYRNRPPPFYFI
ncbi:hypothetical protein N0B40_10440 [Chryseobacterium oranimense]|uniref:hypothetical protein n=1 Tax=Chryseobacterium oranimense TaxID=421058 RepID=UPI0021AE7AFB|nr:hypothetical protein [Chryseobacterium oranimense]UWX58860.1 hypothetical protein N0B40_10440 [Chryseobacterium oranimense]